MPTSALDLLARITEATVVVDPDAVLADSAAVALGAIGRALDTLAARHEAAESVALARRALVVRELAGACRDAAAQWPACGPLGAGRLPDLAGAAADVVCLRADRFDPGERWAAAIGLGDAARQCAELATRFAPYASIPVLTRVLRLTDVIARIGGFDPPEPAGRATLDAFVPNVELLPDSPPGRRVLEAAAALVSALERDTRDNTLTLYAALAACAVAESAARHGAALASVLDNMSRGGTWPRAADGWRVMQAALIRFDDGSRRSSAPPSQVTEWAVQLQKALATYAMQQPGDPTGFADAATATRFVANQFPAVARHVETSVHRWAHAGVLLARARSLPSSEEHVRAVIRDEVVIVTPRDIGSVLLAARVAGRLSTALAVELDRSAGRVGHQPQPHLAAALRAPERTTDAQRARLDYDAHWASRLAARSDAITNRQTLAR